MGNWIVTFAAFAWPALAAYTAANAAHSLYVLFVASPAALPVTPWPEWMRTVRDVAWHVAIGAAAGLCAWSPLWTPLILAFGVLLDLDHAWMYLFPGRCQYGRLSHSLSFLLFSAGVVWLAGGDVRFALAAAAGFCAHLVQDGQWHVGVTPRSSRRLGRRGRALAAAFAIMGSVLAGRLP
jgi:hypothetical protein